jgi:hypothetical protein
MNRNLRTFVLVAVLAIFGMNQSKAQADFSIHFGMASPLGSFADYQGQDGSIAWLDNTNRAGAGSGIDAGMKFRYNLSAVKGLGIIATADLFYNAANSDVKAWANDFEEEELIYSNVDVFTLTLPKYINIPVMMGMNYEYGLAKGIKLWGEFGLGVDFGLITDFRLYGSGEDYFVCYDENGHQYYVNGEETRVCNYETTASLAYQFGIGVMVADRLSIGLHYYALGSQKVKGEASYEEIYEYGDDYFEDEKFTLRTINPAMFTIRLGYHF